ncbi:hypothetical protein THIOKS12170008 [Thiocapsa sp. KS1]|nr:hypothetical protein THIOKS12170008 [Thiocapsa sp. KS1]
MNRRSCGLIEMLERWGSAQVMWRRPVSVQGITPPAGQLLTALGLSRLREHGRPLEMLHYTGRSTAAP